MKAPAGIAFAGLLFALLGGCAVQTLPQEPPVVVLPAATKTYAAFQQDDVACRTEASNPAKAPSVPSAPAAPSGSAVAAGPSAASGGAAAAPAVAAVPPGRVYANCMVARGNTLQPAAAGPASGSAVAYPAYGYDPWLYGDPALNGFWGGPFLFGFYGGFGRGYYPGRYFAGHPMGFYHGGFHGGGSHGGYGGGFAAHGGFHGGGGGHR